MWVCANARLLQNSFREMHQINTNIYTLASLSICSQDKLHLPCKASFLERSSAEKTPWYAWSSQVRINLRYFTWHSWPQSILVLHFYRDTAGLAAMQSTTKNLIKTRAPVIVTLRNSRSACWVKGKDEVVLWWFPKLLPTHIACRQVGDVLSSVDCAKTAGSWQVTMISCFTFLYSWRKQTPKPVILRIKLGHQRSSVEAAWPQSIEVEPNSLNAILLGMNLQVTVTFLVEKKHPSKRNNSSLR